MARESKSFDETWAGIITSVLLALKSSATWVWILKKKSDSLTLWPLEWTWLLRPPAARREQCRSSRTWPPCPPGDAWRGHVGNDCKWSEHTLSVCVYLQVFVVGAGKPLQCHHEPCTLEWGRENMRLSNTFSNFQNEKTILFIYSVLTMPFSFPIHSVSRSNFYSIGLRMDTELGVVNYNHQ